MISALALTACGGDESSSPTKTLATLQAAAKDKDGEKLCGLFTQNGLENGDPETVDFKKEGDAWKIDESFP